MMQDHFDIIISGAGLAGLVTAVAFGTAGFDVLCVDPAPPVTERDKPGADLRSTAFFTARPRFHVISRAVGSSFGTCHPA